MRRTRRLVQFAFLALTLVGVYFVRGHAERWCPFGGIEALYGYIKFGELTCSLHVSNFYILGGLLVLTLIAKRAFCGWVCPVGTLSEWLNRAGRALVRAVSRRNGRGAARAPAASAFDVPLPLNRALRLLKYPLLGVILWFTWRTGELIFRGFDPCYALISRHGTDITFWAYVISALLALLSLFIAVPFCRWLCPLAAVLAPFSRLGALRIRRDVGACLDCGACRRVCPMAIPVDRCREVTAARCTTCLECVAACPPSSGALSWGPPRRLSRVSASKPQDRMLGAGIGQHWPSVAVLLVLLVCIGGAVALSYALPLPSFMYSRGAAPAQTAVIELRVRGVNCRHSTQQFWQFLTMRNDAARVQGWLRLETWPDPKGSDIRISFDPTAIDERRLKSAIAEPTFDATADTWRASPYCIDGYVPDD